MKMRYELYRLAKERPLLLVAHLNDSHHLLDFDEFHFSISPFAVGLPKFDDQIQDGENLDKCH